MIAHLKLVEPCNENRQVEPTTPRRLTNAEMRSREYLTPAEIEKLIKAAKDGRWGLRDACLVMVAYRHGLRAKEACELEWSQVEFGRSAALHVRRAKKGKPAVHPIRGDELRMLTALRKEYPDSGYVFTTERGTPFTTDAIICFGALSYRWSVLNSTVGPQSVQATGNREFRLRSDIALVDLPVIADGLHSARRPIR